MLYLHSLLPLNAIKNCYIACFCFHGEEQLLWMSFCSEDIRYSFLYFMSELKGKKLFMQCDLVTLCSV